MRTGFTNPLDESVKLPLNLLLASKLQKLLSFFDFISFFGKLTGKKTREKTILSNYIICRQKRNSVKFTNFESNFYF